MAMHARLAARAADLEDLKVFAWVVRHTPGASYKRVLDDVEEARVVSGREAAVRRFARRAAEAEEEEEAGRKGGWRVSEEDG